MKAFVEEITPLSPARIVLECDGFARGWSEACAGTSGKAVVVRLNEHSSDVCLVDSGLLSHATRIDLGTAELLSGQEIRPSEAERLRQDIEAALELFGADKGQPIFIVGAGSPGIAMLARHLSAGGMRAEVSIPRGWSATDGLAAEGAELVKYLPETGAAILALEDTKEINVFGRLYRPREDREQAPRGIPLRKALAIAVSAAVVTVAVWYGLDKYALWRTEKLLNEVRDGMSVTSMLRKHKAISETAASRPDMLDIFAILKEAAPPDVTFHNFLFRKGKPVSITGQARNNDSLYKFEAALRTKKGIASVKEQSAVKDERDGKVVFTVTFDYRTFTRGQSEPLAAFGK
jgi:hypothetical protein